MERARPPLEATRSLTLACAILAGMAVGSTCVVPKLGWAIALVGVSLAWGGRRSLWTLGLGLGLAIVWRAGPPTPPIDPRRPVSVTARLVGEWRQVEDGWLGWVRIERMTQGNRVTRGPRRAQLLLPEAPQRPASRWRVQGYLRRPVPLANGGSSRQGPWRLRVKSHRLASPLSDSGGARRVAALARSARAGLRRAIDEAAPEGRVGGGLAKALVLGDASALPEGWLRGLRRAGLSHTLALSGLHVGVLAGWCLLVGRRVSRPWRLVVVLLCTTAYLLLAGSRPSLVRAGLMVAATCACSLLARAPRPLHGLAWAAVALASMRPEALAEVGFRLTFAATAGIVIAQRLAMATDGRREAWRRMVVTTLAAQLATLPISVPVFSWLPAWAWCWNLLLVPVVMVAVPICLAWSLLAWISAPAATSLVWGLDLLASGLALPAGLPAAWLGGAPLALSVPAALAISLVLFGLARSVGWWTAVLGLLMLARHDSGAPSPPVAAQVRFLDVGQGDATLLVEGDRGLLIDGGGWRGSGLAERGLLPALAQAGVREIEVAILSHADRDHCSGLVELSSFLELGEVWMSAAAWREPCGTKLGSRASRPPRVLWRGARRRWRRWEFQILGPAAGERATGNDTSLVVRASALGRSLLLTGDIGEPTERRLVAAWHPGSLVSDLLKVSHHGSGSSSSLTFLRNAAPRLAVVSAGPGNPFGHPAAVTLARFRQQAIPVLRIDRSGSVVVRWQAGSRLEITTPGAPK